MIVTFVIDDKYVNQLLFVLHECIRNSNKKHKYFVFFEDLERASVNMIEDLALLLNSKVELRKIQNVSTAFENGHIGKASMIRLNVPDYLDETYMHLDVDTLPLKGWDEIEEFSPSANETISAVPIPWLCTQEDSVFNQAVQIMGQDYFQAGIYLLNPTGWENHKLHDRVLLLSLEYSELGFQYSDQCILNYSIQKCYKRLSQDFNTLPSQFKFTSTRIIHFAGPNKPWRMNYFKHFKISLRHVLSARQTANLLIQRQFSTAASGYRDRVNQIIREFFCLFLYRKRNNKFKRIML